MHFWLRVYGVGRITGVSAAGMSAFNLEIGTHPLAFSWGSWFQVSWNRLGVLYARSWRGGRAFPSNQQ